MNKVLVTGASGFIGSHLAERCVSDGLEVKAFVRYNSSNKWGWLENSKYLRDIEIHTGDIRDYDSVYKATEGCKIVFHLAALVGIPYSYISPAAYIKTNIEGTYNVLEAARNRNFEQILITSTSETYGTAQYVPIDEKHPLIGQSPYSASKISADQLSLSYYYSYKAPVKIVRPFNTYGPRQSARAIIPSVIIQLLSEKSKLNIGNLYPTRDFTFVEDTVTGFIEIFKSDKLFGEVTNIGINEEISVENLIKLICSIIYSKSVIKTEKKRVRPKGSEVERLLCDNSKILKFTNWKPVYSLRKGLIETINWIKENLHLFKSEIYNV
ncbi:MAG: NAD-dependent epimerase/dehydratase family protein [Ignavibacteria bacterium]|nr:NAD-dependent epimerase/dehydratase family protein [Ignavibacteria bacterium]